VRQAKLTAAAGGAAGGASAGGGGVGSGGVGRGGSAGGGGSAGPGVDPDDVMNGVPPGMQLFGRPGPYDRRYYFDRTRGGTIVGLDPLREKPRPERPSSS
jgi:hypothetical protein